MIKASGKPITIHTVATGAAVAGRAVGDRSLLQEPQRREGHVRGRRRQTESLAKVMQKLGLQGKVHAGGFDLTEQTQNLLKAGYIEFTIDQQPYLQGFVPALQLFFYKVSGTQTGPFEAEHRAEVRDQRNGRSVPDRSPATRARPRRPASSSRGRPGTIVASVAQDPASSRPRRPGGLGAVAPGPAGLARDRRAPDRAARGQHHRHHDRRGDLLLGQHEQLLHRRKLRNAAAVLRAVRDPRGGRGVRDDPRRDRPVDRGDVPVRADHLLQAEHLVGLPLGARR